jgi:hypothetical protein
MSTKSVAEKLLMKPDTTVWSSDPSQLDLVGPMPEGVRVAGGPERATTALVFADDSASLRARCLRRTGTDWPVRTSCGSPTQKGIVPTSTATACGRLSASTGCDPSGRCRWTRPGPRCASAPSKTGRRPSRAADSGRVRTAGWASFELMYETTKALAKSSRTRGTAPLNGRNTTWPQMLWLPC